MVGGEGSRGCCSCPGEAHHFTGGRGYPTEQFMRCVLGGYSRTSKKGRMVQNRQGRKSSPEPAGPGPGPWEQLPSPDAALHMGTKTRTRVAGANRVLPWSHVKSSFGTTHRRMRYSGKICWSKNKGLPPEPGVSSTTRRLSSVLLWGKPSL